MPIKLYRQLEQPDVPESGIGQAVRNVVSSGSKALFDVASLATIPESIYKFGEQTRNKAIEHALKPGNEAYLYGSNRQDTQKGLQNLKENTYKPKVAPVIEKTKDFVGSFLPEGYLEPKSENERVFQDYASMLPLYFLGGGSKALTEIGKFFGKVAAGRYAGSQLEKLGLGTTGRLVGEIGVPALFEILNLKNIKKHFEPFKNKSYENLPEIAGSSKIDATSIQQVMENINKEAKGRMHSKKIFENLEDIEKSIINSSLNVKDLQPLKTKLNTLIYQDNLDSLKPLLSKVNEEIKKVPSYGQAVTKADKLHMNLLNLDSKIEDTQNFIQDSIKKVPVKKAYWIKKGASLLVDNPAIDTIKISGKLATDFPKESAQYAINAFKAASKKNSGALLSSLNQLGKLIEKSEEIKPDQKIKLYRSAL